MKTKYLIISFAVLIAIALMSCVPYSSSSTKTPEPIPPAQSASKTPDIQTINHGYYPEKEEFIYGLMASNGGYYGSLEQPHILTAMYIQRTFISSSDMFQTAYNFELSDTGKPIQLQLPAGFADAVKLTPDEVYKIISEAYPGWPPSYGLIISQDSNLIFIGISDWRIDGRIKIDDEFFPVSNLPLTIKETRVLTDHYQVTKFGKSTSSTMTAKELEITLKDKRVTLHHGESAVLDDYRFELLRFMEIKWVNPPTDVGRNQISYVISRIIN